MSRAARRRPADGLRPGEIVAERYRIVEKLGEGGMAQVFRAEDLATERHVAVKVLHRHIATNPEAVERTRREGQVLSDLDNPAIVSVETFGELPDGTVFLVMELLEGETLGARMKHGALDPVELAPIVAGTCAGLHAAHARGIVHRDLKPDNIFLCPTPHGLQVKLLDFGISKVYGHEKLTQTGEVLGTPRYMSPEQLGAEPDVDARVDVYALGVILYEALADQPPFLASQPTDLIIAIINGKVAPLRAARPDVPPAVEAVVMRAFAKVRSARFDTAMSLADAYIDAVGGASAVRGQQRRGMATRLLGGGLEVTEAPRPSAVPETNPPPAPRRPSDVAGELRLGTFSELDGAPAPEAEAPAPAPAKATMSMGMARGAALPVLPGSPLATQPEEESWEPPASQKRPIPPTRSPDEPNALPTTRETPLELGDPPSVRPSAAPSERRLAATAMMDASQPAAASSSDRPTPTAPEASAPTGRGARVLLILGALLAGAGSAAAVIGGLQWYESQREETHAEPDTLPVVAPATTPTGPAPLRSPSPSVAPRAAPAPAPVPTAEPEAPAPEASPSPRPARRRARRSRGPDSEDEAEETPGGSSPTLPGFDPGATPEQPPARDRIREAQSALRAGDPQRCVQLLDEAIRAGAPAISLRRRADCYEASGQRSAAVRDYQRFCRLVPDHPSVSEVRPLLESWGRTCP